MNPIQRIAFKSEIARAKSLVASGDLEAGFARLERAHVIGQQYVLPHITSHWLMFRVEWRRRRIAAVLGQLMRIVLGALGSAIGVVPTGNTGGTDISMFKRLAIDADLQHIIDGIAPDEQARRPIP